jgi:hypothetical protein
MLAAALAPVPVWAFTDTCNGQRFSVRTLVRNTSTTSQTFININGAAVPFTIPGTTATCVVVAFSAEVFGSLDYPMAVRAVLDGSVVAEPGEVPFFAKSGGQDSRSFHFAFARVPPGPHVLRMQLRSPSGGTIAINKHTTVIHHR